MTFEVIHPLNQYMILDCSLIETNQSTPLHFLPLADPAVKICPGNAWYSPSFISNVTITRDNAIQPRSFFPPAALPKYLPYPGRFPIHARRKCARGIHSISIPIPLCAVPPNPQVGRVPYGRGYSACRRSRRCVAGEVRGEGS